MGHDGGFSNLSGNPQPRFPRLKREAGCIGLVCTHTHHNIAQYNTLTNSDARYSMSLPQLPSAAIKSGGSGRFCLKYLKPSNR